MKSVEEGPIVGTRVGRLRGMRESDLAVFRSIPYAAVPVGERRWRATEPVLATCSIRSKFERR